VLDYYFVLRSVLRDKPQVRHLLARCRHCGIFFIADPRNVGRVDLGCPFGCAGQHRRRCSNKRSAAYNRSPVGKLKRARRQKEQRLAEGLSAPEGIDSPEVRSVEVPEASLDTVGPSVEPISPDLRNDHPHPALAVIPPASDPMAIGPETAAPGTAAHTGDVDPSHGEPDPGAIGAPPAGSEPLFPSGIVSYIRVVISLLEGRTVHREEILEMLARTRRQHSFAREKRIDYVLRRLSEEPQKPP
jgi:hypothetical protein